MKVKKTLGEISAELEELKKLRDQEAMSVAGCMSTKREDLAKTFLKDYKHYNKLIDYYSKIKVEYEDKYADRN